MAFGHSAVFLLVMSVANFFGTFNTPYVDVCLSLFNATTPLTRGEPQAHPQIVPVDRN